MRLRMANFIKNSSLKSFNNRLVYKKVGHKCICETALGQYTKVQYNFFAGATESGRAMGGCIFRKVLPINALKR